MTTIKLCEEILNCSSKISFTNWKRARKLCLNQSEELIMLDIRTVARRVLSRKAIHVHHVIGQPGHSAKHLLLHSTQITWCLNKQHEARSKTMLLNSMSKVKIYCSCHTSMRFNVSRFIWAHENSHDDL